MADLQEVFDQLRLVLARYQPPLVPVADSAIRYELQFNRAYETRSALTGKVSRKQDLYFAGIVLRKSFVTLYFMPAYSHRDEFADLVTDLARLLKGKSCFHLTSMSPEMQKAVDAMLAKGFALYSSFSTFNPS